MISPARMLQALLLVLLTAACATVVQPPPPPPTHRAAATTPTASSTLTAPTTLAAPAAPAAPATPAAPAAPAAHGTVTVYVTFYGGPDNDPPGSTDIAYPNSRHGSAGGAGSYTYPVTLATDPRELPPGTVVYLPQWQKYFVMEDDCAECIDEWSANHHPHVDLWTGASGSRLLACEEALTPDGPVPLEINPPPDRPVDPRPLYNPATDHCWSTGS